MKRRAESEPRLPRRPANTARPQGPQAVLLHAYPLLVHPVANSRDEILVIAAHLARRAAEQLGKPTPEFSQNAASFLAGQPWTIDDLAKRIARAVATNQGSLIIAADLQEQPPNPTPRRARGN